ncbi:MAG: OmpA family protein [Rhodocyclaceae bacterium]|nr:OmpA family protein [Rhodocyclaceae bacterium]
MHQKIRRCATVLAYGAIVLSGACQAGTPIAPEASADAFVELLGANPAGPLTRSFTVTAPPQGEDNRCAAPDGRNADPQRQRNLIPYAADGAPSVDMALQFDTGSDRVLPDAARQLGELAKALNDARLAGARFAIAGHTDATGDESVNRMLSCARALSVRKYLIQKGVAAYRIAAFGFGSGQRVEPTGGESARNRRVEIRRAP